MKISDKKMPELAVVVLCYNSETDLMISAPQLEAQKDVNSRLIIVDNDSQPESVEKIKNWLFIWKPNAIVGTKNEVDLWVSNNPEKAKSPGQVYFILNHENRGYSAGNNIGIRLAENLGAEAVLIANPDMRFDNANYLVEISKELFANQYNYVVASRIFGLDGIDQNPLRESTFLEELLWPGQYLLKILNKKINSYVLPTTSTKSKEVPKVSGCCLMLRMSFLKLNKYLDEGVFLYCEEPILSAQVKASGGKIIYSPRLSAVHAHISSKKGDTGKRMLYFIKSRKYYLKYFSGYQLWQLMLLEISYKLLMLLHKLRSYFTK